MPQVTTTGVGDGDRADREQRHGRSSGDSIMAALREPQHQLPRGQQTDGRGEQRQRAAVRAISASDGDQREAQRAAAPTAATDAAADEQRATFHAQQTK